MEVIFSCNANPITSAETSAVENVPRGGEGVIYDDIVMGVEEIPCSCHGNVIDFVLWRWSEAAVCGGADVTGDKLEAEMIREITAY